MKIAIAIYFIGTILFILSMVKQFKILSTAKEHDPLLKSKLLFFLFILFDVLTTVISLCAFYFRDENLLIPSAVFYICSSFICFWTYYHKHKT